MGPVVRERCRELLEALRAAVPFQLATVWARAGDTLVPVASVGRPLDLLESVPFERGVGLRAWVLQTGRAVRIPASKRRGFRDAALRGFLAVPVERSAVLTLARADAEFTEEDERRAREAAHQLARVLSEARSGA